jgi:hypothetical protein
MHSHFVEQLRGDTYNHGHGHVSRGEENYNVSAVCGSHTFNHIDTGLKQGHTTHSNINQTLSGTRERKQASPSPSATRLEDDMDARMHSAHSEYHTKAHNQHATPAGAHVREEHNEEATATVHADTLEGSNHDVKSTRTAANYRVTKSVDSVQSRDVHVQSHQAQGADARGGGRSRSPTSLHDYDMQSMKPAAAASR